MQFKLKLPILASLMLMPVFALMVSPSHADKANFSVQKTFSADGNPHFIGVNSHTQRLYASDVTAGTVTLFDAVTGLKLVETATGAGAHTVVVDALNNLVYVTNRGANTLSILNGETLAKITDIAVGTAPHGLDLDYPRHQIYVSNTGSHNVTVIDMDTRKVIKTIASGEGPWGVTHHPEKPWIYTSNTNEGTISRIDLLTGQTLAKTTVGGRPWSIRFSAETKQVYATNETLGLVTVLKRDAIVAEVPVGQAPHGFTFVEDDFIAVAATGSNQVTIIDLENNKVVQKITVDAGPTSLTADAKGRHLYVACQAGGKVNVLVQPGD